MTQSALSIYALNLLIKERLLFSPELNNIWISGEITSFKTYPYGGQSYLTLSDKQAQINCVVYDNTLQNIKFKPAAGQIIFALGKVILFPKKGSLIFQIHFMSTQGTGQLSQEFERLKEQLQKEGCFDEDRKKPIPKYPNHIGLITANNSAAMWDFVTIFSRLAPQVPITVIPAVMQGASSVLTLLHALTLAANHPTIDTVIVLRGGGAKEDLTVFNSEELVRAIAQFPKPILTAIGHEIDTSLSDLASDLRCPTPTAAAHYLGQSFYHITHKIIVFLTQTGPRLKNELDDYQETVLNSIKFGQKLLTHKTVLFAQKQSQLLTRLKQANPLHKLQQGYSIIRLKKSNKIIKSISQLQSQDILEIELSDGKCEAIVK
ncbi:MAG: exodeoxyribonuclease VII large subunit [Candidatus Margulisbacteria bacterium]|nr:exodeoxyribonuclease VII large subunit [Candidatus Margulisiibacteriota bacterium]